MVNDNLLTHLVNRYPINTDNFITLYTTKSFATLIIKIIVDSMRLLKCGLEAIKHTVWLAINYSFK